MRVIDSDPSQCGREAENADPYVYMNIYIYILVAGSTPLKNMLVKLDHFSN